MKIEYESENMGTTFGPSQLEHRPQLAIKIAMVANAWASLEAGSGSCLGTLLRGDSKASIAMLSKVQTASQKSQAIRAVGTAILDEPELGELKSLLSRFDALAVRRNAVVHGMWGTTPQFPDKLVWAPPEVVTQTVLGMIDQFLAGNGEEYLEKQKSKFVVYGEAEFDSIISDIKQLVKDLTAFTNKQHVAQLTHRFSGSHIPT